MLETTSCLASALRASLEPARLESVVLEPLPERQRMAAIIVAVGILVLVLELVRRRKLREEYSWFWCATGMLLIALAMFQGVLVEFSRWIGAASPVSTLFFGAILFLVILALQFSVRLSRLTHRNRTLAQRVSLLEDTIQRLQGERSAPDAKTEATPRRRKPSERDEVA